MSASAPPPSEVLKVIERAAARPDGFELLETGGVEAVAVLFEVRPASVEAARALCQDPRRRQAVVETVGRAAPGPERNRVENRRAAAPSAPSVTVKQLLGRIQSYPGGPELLRRGPAETVAILFGAHPFVVARAREIACG